MADVDQQMSGGLARLAKRLLAAPFVIVAAAVILIEDWLWDDLARLAAAIGRLPILRSVEAFIASLPPYPALLFFATPALLLVPLKLVALFFMSHGQATLGVLTIIAAKFVGTALVARIFVLTVPSYCESAGLPGSMNDSLPSRVKSTRRSNLQPFINLCMNVICESVKHSEFGGASGVAFGTDAGWQHVA